MIKRQKSRGGAIKLQKFQGEGVIERQKSKGGPIKSLKFQGGLVNWVIPWPGGYGEKQVFTPLCTRSEGRAVTRALIGRVYIHIFRFCLTSFF